MGWGQVPGWGCVEGEGVCEERAVCTDLVGILVQEMYRMFTFDPNQIGLIF